MAGKKRQASRPWPQCKLTRGAKSQAASAMPLQAQQPQLVGGSVGLLLKPTYLHATPIH